MLHTKTSNKIYLLPHIGEEVQGSDTSRRQRRGDPIHPRQHSCAEIEHLVFHQENLQLWVHNPGKGPVGKEPKYAGVLGDGRRVHKVKVALKENVPPYCPRGVF